MTKDQEKDLSLAESEVYLRLCQGMSNQEIADALFVDIKTIKWHVSSILKKLDLKSRAQVIAQRFNKIENEIVGEKTIIKKKVLSDYETVAFTKGVMDLIWDFIEIKFPIEFKELQEVKTEITSRNIIRNTDVGYYVREIISEKKDKIK